jgi:hypothetical protein
MIERVIVNLSSNPFGIPILYMCVITFWLHLLGGFVEYFLMMGRFPVSVQWKIFTGRKSIIRRVVSLSYITLVDPLRKDLASPNAIVKITIGSAVVLFFVILLILHILNSLATQNYSPSIYWATLWLLIYMASYVFCMYYGIRVRRQAQELMKEEQQLTSLSGSSTAPQPPPPA